MTTLIMAAKETIVHPVCSFKFKMSKESKIIFFKMPEMESSLRLLEPEHKYRMLNFQVT